MINNIEDQRNKLNLELRSLLSIIKMIDGLDYEYANYQEGVLSEEEFLKQQLILVEDAKTRLVNVFKN